MRMLRSNHCFAKLGMAVAFTLLGASANATEVTWDFSSAPATTTNSFTWGATGSPTSTLTLSAYYASSNTSTWDTSFFRNFDPTGFGIAYSGSPDPNTSPQHAIDSLSNATSGGKDIVVIDAGAGKTVNWNSLLIGWGIDDCALNSAGTGCLSLASNTRADIKIWTGNDLNPTTATFNATLGAATGTKTINNAARCSNNDLSTCTFTSMDSGTPVGASRYLVMAGDVGDAFKFRALKGEFGNPSNQTPEPASLGLLGLGLLGFAFARRRKAKA